MRHPRFIVHITSIDARIIVQKVKNRDRLFAWNFCAQDDAILLHIINDSPVGEYQITNTLERLDLFRNSVIETTRCRDNVNS